MKRRLQGSSVKMPTIVLATQDVELSDNDETEEPKINNVLIQQFIDAFNAGQTSITGLMVTGIDACSVEIGSRNLNRVHTEILRRKHIGSEDEIIDIVVVKKIELSCYIEPKILGKLSKECNKLVQALYMDMINIDCSYSVNVYMEIFSRGNLINVLTLQEDGYKLSWENKLKITLHTIYGLSFLHKQNILHRDIKPANILVAEDYSAKLGDYGSAVQVEDCNKYFSNYGHVGTIQYMAPELVLSANQLTELNIEVASDAACDVYSFSATLWQLITNNKRLFIKDTEDLDKICFSKIDSDDFEMLRNARTNKNTLKELTNIDDLPEPVFMMFKNIVDRGCSIYPIIRLQASDIVREVERIAATYVPKLIKS